MSKIYVRYYRPVIIPDNGEVVVDRWFRNKKHTVQPLPTGGVTVADLVNDDGVVEKTAIAYCSKKDNFCYSLGRKIAVGRLLSLCK